jgi:signal transduction histidine kinase
MSRSRERLAPLAALVGGTVFAACTCTLVVAAIVLHTRTGLDIPLWQVVVAGGPMALVIAVAAAWLATRFARTLRLLRADALRRLHDPSAPVGSSDATSVPAWTGSEMVELARTLEALHLRVRMSDEVGERHRRSAETASAGMFELLAGLVEAEEGARGQLSAELHDTVAQSLSAARSLLAEGLDVTEAAELIAEAEDQVRAVMARTRPPALREGDLARAVGGLRDDLANRYALDVEVDWPAEAYPLPLVTAVTVYRFFQEGLLNVV